MFDPTIKVKNSLRATTSEKSLSPFETVVVADRNAKPSETLAIALTGSGGTLSGTGLAGSGGTYTLTGTLAAVNQALAHLSFTPTAGAPHSASTTTFTLSDTSSAGTSSLTPGVVTVVDHDPAVAPTVTVTASSFTTTSEHSVVPFGGVTIGDGNATPSDTLTITLAGRGGTLSGTGLTGSGKTYTLTGTPSAIDSALGGLSFTPKAGQPDSTGTTTFTLHDKSNAGTSTAKPGIVTVADHDPAVAPTLTVKTPSHATTSEKSLSPFETVVIGDRNAKPSETLTIALTGSGGTLSGTGLAGSGGLYTLTGTLAAVNQALAHLSFTPTAGAPHSASTTTFTLSDTSSAGTSSLTPGVVTVVDHDPAVAPTVMVKTSSFTTTSEHSVTPFGGVTVADGNANPSDTLTITLAGRGGTLSGPGLTGSGKTYTLTGTPSALNAALASLSFTPKAGQPDSVGTTTFTLHDKSNAGTSTAKPGIVTVADHDPAVAPTITINKPLHGITSEKSAELFQKVIIVDRNANASETLTIAVTGSGGTLSGTGLAGSGGLYTLTGTLAAVNQALAHLSFTPTAGAPHSASTTTFTLSDTSSAGTSSLTPGVVTVVDHDPAVAPTVTVTTSSTTTTSEHSVTPFGGVTVADGNANPSDTLTITLAGRGGTLSGPGLTGSGKTYTLTGTPSALNAALASLSFTPKAGQPDSVGTTTFTLHDKSNAGTSSATAGVVTVVDDDPAVAPTLTVNSSVQLEKQTAFVLSGTVSDKAGIASIEAMARIDGADVTIGMAKVDSKGNWTITDNAGHVAQNDLVVTAIDGAGDSTTVSADYSLKAGIGHQLYTAQENQYTADGTLTGQTFFTSNGDILYKDTYTVNPDGGSTYDYSGGTYFKQKPYSSFIDTYTKSGDFASETLDNKNGTHTITAESAGQSLTSISHDTMDAQGFGNTTFVFKPGFGQDKVLNFKASGDAHDTLALSSADFADVAAVLHDTQNQHGSAVITDPVSGDVIKLQDVTKAQLTANKSDFQLT